MTGPLEWLSQAPLETRKAEQLIALSAPVALRGIQMAERNLLRSAYGAEVSDRRRAVGDQFAALLAAAEQRIITHIQGKIALIDPTLSSAARRAAIEQLIAEQSAAIVHLRQDIKQQRRQARRAASAGPRGKFKKLRRALVVDHATERKSTLSLFGTLDHPRHRPHRAFSATRRMIPLLKMRRLSAALIVRPR